MEQTVYKILTLADKECSALWDPSHPERCAEYDLILSCGDLNPAYLSFLATYTHAPILYVRGNHDDRYSEEEPAGCICIENKIYTWNGIRILGLGGSLKYNDGENQYTETQMAWRIGKMTLPIAAHRGFDLLLTHAPIQGFHDLPDRVHKGFACFDGLVKRWKPALMVHGHVHRNYAIEIPRISEFGETKVVNAYERCVVEWNRETGEIRTKY